MPLLIRGSWSARTTLALGVIAAACGSPSGPVEPGIAQPPASGASSTGRASAPAPGPTVVSLTFDDGLASAYKARPLLAERGMHATFYVNSGHVEQHGFMTWKELRALAGDGNEIGGHTALHVNLPLLDRAEAERQICTDRALLLDRGFDITDFAYPFGSSDAAVEALAAKCGYSSARTTSHVRGSAETIPPARPHAIGVGNDGTPTVDEIKRAVTNAVSAGGGWVPIVFHGICDGCSEMAISERDLETLLLWLEEQRAADVSVRTVREVIGGSVLPAVAGPAAPPPPSGSNGLRNPSLEDDANGDGPPSCWTASIPNEDVASWTRTAAAHEGTVALLAQITGPLDEGPRLAVLEDLGQCTPSVVPGHRYLITAWYTSTVPMAFTTHTREQATFAYWNKSPFFPASTDWALARWVTPAIPRHVDGLSFGIAITEEGSLTVDDLGLDDAAAAE